MWIIIICAAIGLVWGLFDAYEPFWDAVFGVFLGAVIGFLLAIFVGMFAYEKVDFKEKIVLQNMQDNTLIHGQFFLGTGTIDDVPTYSFYVKTGENTYRRRDIDAANADIHYTNDAPNYVKHWKESEKGFVKTWYLNSPSGPVDVHYDFYIPRGSITSEYRLDAK